MIFDLGNCIFTLQICVAEMLFLYSYPKRTKFFLRLVVLPAIILIAGLYPSASDVSNQVYHFFKYLLLFALTVCGQAFCFKISFAALISACSSGYALQHMSYYVMQLVALTPLFGDLGLSAMWREHLLEVVVFPVPYVLTWAVFGRLAAKYEFYKNYDVRLILVSVFTLFVCLIINRFSRLGWSSGNDFVIITNALYAISCCILALFINYNLHVLNITRTQNKTLERISYEEQRQFEASKKNREQLNIKYHDLKHVLSLFDADRDAEAIKQYRKVLEDYDSEIRTGNETLDIVVNEKVDSCKGEGVSITFLGDGQLLSFVSQYDIYSLFGNILDNAIEAVRKVEDASKRIISVTIESQGNCIAISSLNYFSGSVKMADGLPVTTKTTNIESHGFGIRSIKLVAEKYHGRVEIKTGDGMFELIVFLMVPAADASAAVAAGGA